MALIFYLTYVRLGFGTVNELKSECARVDIRRSMVVTDKGVAAVGPAQHMTDAVGGLPVTMLDETLSNPIEAMVLKAAVQYKDAGCDRLIAIGGGSSIDLAKGIAIAATYLGSLTTYVAIEGDSTKITEVAAPLIAISITAGMGGEVTRGTIITLEGGRKLGFHPWHLLSKPAICDAELTLGLPPALTAAIGTDATAHCIEAFLAPAFNPLADGIALDGLERVWANIERATCDGTDRDTRLSMMSASMQGAMAFQKGLGCVYSLLHPLGGMKVGGKTGSHHDMLNVVVLSAVLRLSETAETVVRDNRYTRVRRMMNLSAGADLAQTVHGLTARPGLPTGLRQMGVPEDALEHVVEGALLDYCHKTNSRIVTADDYRRMLVESM